MIRVAHDGNIFNSPGNVYVWLGRDGGSGAVPAHPDGSGFIFLQENNRRL